MTRPNPPLPPVRDNAITSGELDFDGRTINVTGRAAVTHAELPMRAGDISRSLVTCVPSPPGSIFDMAIAKGWLGTATDAVLELTGQRATSVAEFLAEHIDFLIEAVEPPRAFASNRSR